MENSDGAVVILEDGGISSVALSHCLPWVYININKDPTWDDEK